MIKENNNNNNNNNNEEIIENGNMRTIKSIYKNNNKKWR